MIRAIRHFFLAMTILVLSGCGDIDAEIATAASLADAIAQAKGVQ